MENPAPIGLRYRFGPFELDPQEGRLAKNGTRVKVQDLPLRLLAMLVERPGEIVTRDEVRQRLWPDNTFVEFDNSLGVAIRKVRDSLNDDAETPKYVETIPRRGYRFLAPVTVQGSSTPRDKTTDAAALSMAAPASGLAARPVSRFWVIALLALLFVGIVVYEFRASPRRGSSKAEASGFVPPMRARRSIAVLGFRNLPARAEDNWLSSAFAEMLNTELGAGGDLRMISGEDVARAKRELPLTDQDSLAKATLERLRINPGADVVVLGSYTLLPSKSGNRIRLDVRLQDTVHGETLAEQAFTGNENELFELAYQAGVALRQNLGVNSVSSEATTAARAALPANQTAFRLYTEGRAKLWSFDYAAARELLEKAVAADPKYPLAHAALSEALWHSGYQVKARAEAQQALDLSDHLSQQERLLVQGQYRRSIADWPGAVQAYRSLVRLFPDSLDYGLLLASGLIEIKPADALQTLETLRRLPPPMADDPRIDMMESRAWINTDFTKSRAAAERGISKARAQGEQVLVSESYGTLCQQGPAVGASAETISDCQGSRNGEAMMTTDLAALYYQQGDLAQAEKMWRQASKEFREIGNLDGVATALSNIGGDRLTEGNLDEAKRLLQESIPLYQATEDKEGVALTLSNLGDLSRQQGNLEIAETTYQQAKGTAQEIDDKDAMGYALQGLGDVFTDRGDLAAARKFYEQSLAVRQQAGEKQTAAETQTALAQLAIEEGHAGDAEAAARDCSHQFQQGQQADDELTASEVLVQALLEEGKRADARKAMEEAQPLMVKSQNRLVRLRFTLVSARVVLASEHPELAQKMLEQTIQEARAHGFLGVELEARLTLAELAKKTGHSAASREQLSSLQKAAQAKGFGLIARKASNARG
jgi:DNA-binding winged helix-turn-helix (wHTH) protein/tetratricopeptide (TPR) repeat protein